MYGMNTFLVGKLYEYKVNQIKSFINYSYRIWSIVIDKIESII
jgi:hypothetical protein